MGREVQDTHIYFPIKIWRAIKKLAERNRRSLSAEIVIAVEERVSRENEAREEVKWVAKSRS